MHSNLLAEMVKEKCGNARKKQYLHKSYSNHIATVQKQLPQQCYYSFGVPFEPTSSQYNGTTVRHHPVYFIKWDVVSLTQIQI